MFYNNVQVYGLPLDCHLKSSGTIHVKVLDKPNGWTVCTCDDQVAYVTVIVHTYTFGFHFGDGTALLVHPFE